MEADSIQTYEKLEKSYWWFVGRRRVIESVLKVFFHNKLMRVLDWGCGPGGNFPSLSKYGHVVSVDASPESVQFCRQKGIENVVQANTLDDFKSDKPFDLITCFDVLEHITEDEKFLADFKKFLVPGGYVLVTVPAYQFLWSEFDRVLGHVRRYDRAEIVEKFEGCGFEVVKASYFMFFLAPIFIMVRISQKLLNREPKSLKSATPEVSKALNWIFKRMVFLEASLMRFLNLPFGTSILILARKN